MEGLEIKHVQPRDVEWVIALFAQRYYTVNPDEAKVHFADHVAGGAETFLAFVGGELAGFVTIRWVSENIRFREANIPLIHHLEVFSKYRRQCLAWRLMDEAEALIATRATQVGITVGLFDAYGPAQRLYAKRGYIPDGRGVCRGHSPLKQGETVRMDHDLVLWLTKDLPTAATPIEKPDESQIRATPTFHQPSARVAGGPKSHPAIDIACDPFLIVGNRRESL